STSDQQSPPPDDFIILCSVASPSWRCMRAGHTRVTGTFLNFKSHPALRGPELLAKTQNQRTTFLAARGFSNCQIRVIIAFESKAPSGPSDVHNSRSLPSGFLTYSQQSHCCCSPCQFWR